MEEKDAQKYIIEQAKIEVENTRSWPQKIMAFYVAINFGLGAALIGLWRNDSSFVLNCSTKDILALLIIILSIFVVVILARNHRNYLKYRNLQINFQICHLTNFKEKYKLPEEWFKFIEDCLFRRLLGWGFYLYIVVMVTLLTLAAIMLPDLWAYLTYISLFLVIMVISVYLVNKKTL